MNRLRQFIDKFPTKALILTFISVNIALAVLTGTLDIKKNSIPALIFAAVIIVSFIPLGIRFLSYLKARGSGLYYFFVFMFGYASCAFPIGFLIVLDDNIRLNGYLWISGIILEVFLLIFLLVRYRIKRSTKKRYPNSEGISSSYSFENLCDDFSSGREIEFTYNNEHYLFIRENGRYYFKRIVAVDPYEYEILAEAGNALVCIDACNINENKITGFWSGIENIMVY